jgi:anaerobic magnesium-protoporphyrin IX monomethyl ester cyclase
LRTLKNMVDASGVTKRPDLLVINPGGREKIYQDLGGDLTAIEPPLWSRLIAGNALDQGFDVQMIDSEALAWGPERVSTEVAAIDPLLVAVVVFGHQPSASTQQMAAAGEMCRSIKSDNKKMKIIILGGHVSALPEKTLQEEAVDYVCNGEGPLTIAALLTEFASEEPDFSIVPGLVWWDHDKVCHNLPAALITDLDKDLHGNVWHLLPMDRYRAHNWQCFEDLEARQPYASIYTSLGCPYKCSFCCINAPFGTNRYRMRKPDAVVSEIDHLYNTYGVKTFKIVDEMFVLNDRHVTEICENLAAKPYAAELNIWAYARIDTVRADRLALLRKAGIRWLALGIESGSELVRDGAEKSFDTNDITDIVREIQKAGIFVIGNFIFGLPDDDMKSMRETLDLAKELNCEFANFYSAMAYPGSPLFTQAVAAGWELPKDWSGFSQHSYDCLPLPTEMVSAADVLSFRDNAFHEYFANKHYLDMVTQRFGTKTQEHIVEMASHRLKRQILEEVSAS